MCGTIKYENIAGRIGHLVPVITSSGKIREVPWLGHSRSESLQPKNSEKVYISVSEYTERDISFSVPKGKVIEGWLVQSPNFPRKEGLFIITRPATQEELKKCPHPRHPKISPCHN